MSKVIESLKESMAMETNERARDFILASPKDRTITIRTRRAVDIALDQVLGEMELKDTPITKNAFIEEAIIRALGGPEAVHKLVTE